MNRSQAVNLRAHGLDDSPSSTRCSKGNRRRATGNNPQRNMKGRRKSEHDQRQRYETHRFLGVIGTVAESKGDGRGNLNPIEKVVYPGSRISKKAKSQFKKKYPK